MSSSLILEIYLAPQWQQWQIEMASERELSEKKFSLRVGGQKGLLDDSMFSYEQCGGLEAKIQKRERECIFMRLKKKKMAGNFTKGRPRGIRSSCGENSLNESSYEVSCQYPLGETGNLRVVPLEQVDKQKKPPLPWPQRCPCLNPQTL